MSLKRLLFLFCLLLICTACGKKGPVRPLQSQQPEAVRNLELRQRGGHLLLSWGLPEHNQDGSRITEAPSVDLHRAQFNPGEDCSECLERAPLLAVIDPELPDPAKLTGQRYLFTDTEVVTGQQYSYLLLTRDRAGQAGQPATINLTVLPAASAPSGLQATAQDRSVSLRWEANIPEGPRSLLGYRIYRRSPDLSQPEKLLIPGLLNATEYTDARLINGNRYSYRISAVLQQGEQVLESLFSPVVDAVPQSGL